MKRFNITKISAIILSLCFFLFAVIYYSDVVTAVSVPASGNKGLTVSPIRFEININPGESKTDKIKISNFTDGKMQINLSAEVFSVINPQYDYEFNMKSKIADWIRFSDNTIYLAKGETRTIAYSINIPNSAESGGYYLSIFSSADAGSDDSSIKSKQRVASLLYVTVLGDITKTGKLMSLRTPWLVDEKSMWSMSIQNNGTAHFRSDIKIKLIDFLGKTIKSASGGTPLILPGTVREISGLIPTPKIPGIYKLYFETGLGDSQQKNNTRYVFYAPIWFVTVVTAAFVSIIGFIIYRIKKRR